MNIRLSLISLSLLLFLISGCTALRTTARIPDSGFQEERPLQASEDPEKVPEIQNIPEILQLDGALKLALRHNPVLKIYSMEIRAREAAARQHSSRVNPEIDMEVENFGGSNTFRGFRSSETTLSLGQFIELGGKREKRTQLAVIEADLASWEYESQRLDLATDVSKKFSGVLSAQEKIVLKKELLFLAESFLTQVETRIEAGKLSPAEKSRAQVEKTSAQIELEQAIADLDKSRKTLSALWGSANIPRFRAEGNLNQLSILPPLTDLLPLLKSNPDLARGETLENYFQAGVELQKSQRLPDPQISAGFRMMNESDDQAVVAGISVPIPIFNRQKGAIEESRIRLNQNRYQQKTALLNKTTELNILYTNLETLENELNRLKNEILPEAQKAFEIIKEGFQSGKFSALEVLSSQNTLFRFKENHLDALTEYQLLKIDMERLTGSRVFPRQ